MQLRDFKIPLRTGSIGAAGLVAVLSTTSMVHSQVPPAPVAPVVVTAPVVTPSPAVSEVQRLSDGFTEVASAVLPAVVTIRVESVASPEESMGGMGGMPFPFPFFGPGRGMRGGDEVVHGTGSGVLIRPDGVILTNNHVVENARRISVHLHDGRVLPARVMGTDPASDLAIVKVDAHNLPVAHWGDSEHARVGEWVLAIGAPFGLEATVTHGVLSAMGRAGLGANQIEDYLQTDASINPGNSGGALVNLRGEVLGIPTMIIGRGSNIGFAVPSRIARRVADQIIATGSVTRGWIGVGVQDLTSELATSLGLQPDTGALVSQVDPSGPCARIGLQPGDVITTLDGRPVQHSRDVVREVTDRSPGERVEFTVLRRGATQHYVVQAGHRPEEPRAERVSQRTVQRNDGPDTRELGIEVSPLSPQRARQYGAQGGVVVTNVEHGGAAEHAGLQRGDVILRADQGEVRTPGDLVAATADGHAALLVRRGDRQLFMPLVVQ